MASTTPNTAVLWKTWRRLYPLYCALAHEFVLDVPPCPDLETGVAVPGPEAVNEASSWFSKMDSRIHIHHLRHFAQTSPLMIEPAISEDLDELSSLLGELFSEESDFRPDKDRQLRGLRLIFEQPNRGRVFVLRRDQSIVGMINLLFTISTAEGGFVILLEDLVIHKEYRGHGYGSMLLDYAINFAKQKNFRRITLLTDRPELRSQNFFRKHGFYESPMLPMRLLLPTQTEPREPLL